MSERIRPMLLCARVDRQDRHGAAADVIDDPKPPVRGALQVPCADCQTPLWHSPSSGLDADPLCFGCGMQRLKKAAAEDDVMRREKNK